MVLVAACGVLSEALGDMGTSTGTNVAQGDLVPLEDEGSEKGWEGANLCCGWCFSG